MRVKRKKNGAARLAACGSTVISEPQETLKNISALFSNNNPIHLEIGCGKGDFILGMASAYPDINFIAIERISDVLVTAAEKIKNSGLDNVKVCCFDAAKLSETIPSGSIERIYLNFSDPWPKKGHAKRRLTHKSFLNIYRQILNENGSVFLKTDNDGLFDFSVDEFTADGWMLLNVTRDLHASDFEGNVMTEYEKRFSSQGIKIKRLEAYK